MHLAHDEAVLVLHDDSASHDLVEAYATAATSLGAETLVASYTPTRYVSMRVFGHFAASSLEEGPARLSPPAVAALRAADVAIIVNTDLELLFDPRFLEVARGQTRIGWLPYLDVDNALRLLPSSEEEVRDLHATTTRVGQAFAGGHEVGVTSMAGTDLRMSIGNHRLNWSSGVHEAGKGYGGLEIWPSGQISTVPNAGSAHGTLVIDRSINVPEFKELLDPIRLTVEGGRVVEIDGEVEASRLRSFLEACDHPDVYHLTELGIGTNRLCTAAGIAGPGEDTHTIGCVSFAIGADVHLGGDVRAPIHLDMTQRAATLHLDGRPLVEAGCLIA